MRKKLAFFTCLILCCFLLAGCKSTDYKSAVTSFEAGELDKAEEMFTALGDYKDSAAYLADIPYQRAYALLEAGEYDLAERAFAVLGDYKDSIKMIDETKYQRAVSLLNAGEFDAAEEAFTALGSYRDSSYMIADVQNARVYHKAESCLSSANFKDAYDLFESLGDYSDSVQRLNEVEEKWNASIYMDAEHELAKGEYDKAIRIFQDLGDYSDSAARMEEAVEAKNAKIYADAESYLEQNQYALAIQTFASIEDYSDSKQRIIEAKHAAYQAAQELLDKEYLQQAIDKFAIADDYEDSAEKIKQATYLLAEKNLQRGDAAGYILAFRGFTSLGDYQDSSERASDAEKLNRENKIQYETILDSSYYLLAVCDDGSVRSTGFWYDPKDSLQKDAAKNYAGQAELEEWTDIVSICSLGNTTVGLRSDGTVVAKGAEKDIIEAVKGWSDVIALAKRGQLLGLRSDGTVLATGENENGECEVGDWEHIVKVIADDRVSIGIKADGSVVTTRRDGNGSSFLRADIGLLELTDVVDIWPTYLNDRFYVCKLLDGSIKVIEDYPSYVGAAVEKWDNVKSVINYSFKNIYALTEKGEILKFGDTSYEYYDDYDIDVSEFHGIKQILPPDDELYALREDGTVFSTNAKGTVKEYGWTDIQKLWGHYPFIAGLDSNGVLHTARTGSNATICDMVDGWENLSLRFAPEKNLPESEKTGESDTDNIKTLNSQEMLEIAKCYLDKPLSELMDQIGEPLFSEYAVSCLVPGGEDGELHYEGFTVYTLRSGGSETILDVLD